MDRINIKWKPGHKPNDDVALSTVATMGQVPLTSQGAGLRSWSTCLWTSLCCQHEFVFVIWPMQISPRLSHWFTIVDSAYELKCVNLFPPLLHVCFIKVMHARVTQREKTSDLHFYARLSSVMQTLKLEYLFACQHLFNSDSRVVFYTQLLNVDFWSQLWVMNMQRQILFERSFRNIKHMDR